MKKLNFIFFIAVYLLASCAAPPPHVTVTSEAIVTPPPVPTPTLHPEFAALQQTIADSGSRFTLQADGLIYDGDVPIPGLTVAPDGTMSLTVGGETVQIDPADVDFDDEKGISIKGYDFQDTDGDGMPDSWVEIETNETVTANFDLGVVLSPGPANEDGSRNIETFAPPKEFADNEGAVAKWLKYFDAERLGFDPGATQWILTEDGRAVMVDVADHSKIIAEWKDIPWIGKAAIVWNWANFVEADGENPLLDVCKIWELKKKGSIPIDLNGMLALDHELAGREEQIIYNGVDIMYGGDEELKVSGSFTGAVFAVDGKSIVSYRLMKNPFFADEGFVYTRDVHGQSIILYTDNNDWTSFANRPK